MYLKRIIRIITPVIVLLFASPILAESVFLKDGSIVEGKITKENAKLIELESPEKEKQEIQRSNILRILFHDNYKDKRYLSKIDGTITEVYVVDEDKATYTYRTDLADADEVKIQKNEVVSLSKNKVITKEDINDIVYAILREKEERENTREKKLVSRSAALRPSFTSFKGLSNKEHDGVTLDIFPWRIRTEKGNGLDLLVRGVYSKYEMGNSDLRKTGFETAYSSQWTSLTFSSGSAQYFSGGCGARILFGDYFKNLFMAQGYLLGYFEKNRYWVRSDTTIVSGGKSYFYKRDIDKKYKSRGYSFGGGFEFSPTMYAGGFIEYTYGYTKVETPTSKNGLGHCFRFGLTMRTRVLEM